MWTNLPNIIHWESCWPKKCFAGIWSRKNCIREPTRLTKSSSWWNKCERYLKRVVQTHWSRRFKTWYWVAQLSVTFLKFRRRPFSFYCIFLVLNQPHRLNELCQPTRRTQLFNFAFHFSLVCLVFCSDNQNCRFIPQVCIVGDAKFIFPDDRFEWVDIGLTLSWVPGQRFGRNNSCQLFI